MRENPAKRRKQGRHSSSRCHRNFAFGFYGDCDSTTAAAAATTVSATRLLLLVRMMFTWAQPGSGMFKLISVHNSAVKRNPNKQELFANPRKSSCFSSHIQCLQGVKIKYLKYSLNGDVESKFQGQQQGKGSFFFNPGRGSGSGMQQWLRKQTS